MSVYAYARGNPLSFRDPLGLSPWDGLNGDVTPAEAFWLSAQAAIPSFWDLLKWGAPDGPCPTPPPAPPGVDINTNLAIAQDYSWLNPGSDLAFLSITGHAGVWDYRTNLGQQFDDFGNFNFGATAAAMGFPYYVAQNAAGLYQGDPSTGSGTPFLTWPFGDDLPGALQIQAGYAYVRARSAGKCGCGK